MASVAGYAVYTIKQMPDLGSASERVATAEKLRAMEAHEAARTAPRSRAVSAAPALNAQQVCGGGNRYFVGGVYWDDASAATGGTLSGAESRVLGNGNYAISDFRIVNGLCYALTTIDGTVNGNSYRSQHWMLLTNPV